MKINERPIKIILFIDDLDRCLPEVAFKMIEDIKVWLDIENIVTCLALNKKEIIRVVTKYYKTHLGLDYDNAKILSEDYLFKIIPFGIYVEKNNFDHLSENFKSEFKEDTNLINIKNNNIGKRINDNLSLRKYISYINEYYIESRINSKQ